MRKNKNYNKRSTSNIVFSMLLTIVIFLIFCLLLLTLIKLNILPLKYLLLLTGVILLFDIISVILIWCRRIWKKVLGGVIAISIGIISVFGIVNINKTYGLLDDITTLIEEHELTYYILVKNDTTYKTLDDLKGLKNGILDNNKDNVKKYFKSKVDFSYVEYASIGYLMMGYQNNEIDVITVSSDIYEIIKENYPDIITNLRKLEEATVKTKVTDSSLYKFNAYEPFIIYVSGYDVPNNFPINGRSDVNILLVVNPNTNKILLVNTPRDYYVQIHNTNGLRDKLTHVGYYGIDQSVSTLEDLYDIEINRYVIVTYDAVVNLVNAIDGIDVYSDKTFVTSHNKYYIKEGMNHFNGNQALAFSQERYAYTTGDRHRGENQQAVISAIINKISKNKKYLLEYNNLLELLSHYTSTNAKIEDVQSILKKQINTLASWDVETIGADGKGEENVTFTYPNSKAYVMVPDENSVNEVKNKIKNIMEN